MRVYKRKILIWAIDIIVWVLFFYSIAISNRLAAIELFILIFAIYLTGAAIFLSLRPW